MRVIERLNVHVIRRIRIKVMPSRLTRSIASITFDDFAKSSWRVGGPILARHQAPATYFVSGAFSGRTSDGQEFYDPSDLLGVHAAGHEIGGHTYSHYRVRQVSSDKLLSDAARNERFIRTTVGDVVPETFAYPYGDTSLRTKILFAHRFSCCRGTEPGVNRGALDLGQLKTVSLESRQWNAGAIDRWIADAFRTPCWIIFFTHDIADSPTPYGSTPWMIEEALAKTRAAGFEIMTVKNALARACFGMGVRQGSGNG